MISYLLKTGFILTQEDAVRADLNSDILYYGNYINAMAITLSCICLLYCGGLI